MLDTLQDEALVKADLREHERMVAERAPWETTWREVDELFPDGAGGFNQASPGALRGQQLFDVTHITQCSRFAAAMMAITTPEHEQYIRPRFLDPELNKLRSVQLWREEAGARLYAMRHALHTGFTTAAGEDWDQTGRYGTAPLWCDATEGRGLFYKALHLSKCFIDVDFAGLVNRVHITECYRADQCEEFFGAENLTPKMAKALKENKPQTEFELIHVIAPNRSWDKDSFDHRRFPIGARWLAKDEKLYCKRGGFHSMPVAVSRHLTTAGEIYGRSPAIRVMPTIMGLQQVRKTTLRAAHKAVDPALIFNNDDGVTSLVTKPGGMNAGLVNDMGRPMVSRMPGGEAGLPYAENEAERERAVIEKEFLEEIYKILTDPNSRMTTTEVLEVVSKQGMLVMPFAGRYMREKQHPVSQREIDLALRAGQLPPLPGEVIEAGAWPVVEYENKLAEMARAESAGKSMRYLQALPVMAEIDPNVRHRVNVDAMASGLAEEMGVKPSYLRSDAEVAELIAREEQSHQAAINAELLKNAAGASLDIAKANQVAEAA